MRVISEGAPYRGFEPRDARHVRGPSDEAEIGADPVGDTERAGGVFVAVLAGSDLGQRVERLRHEQQQSALDTSGQCLVQQRLGGSPLAAAGSNATERLLGGGHRDAVTHAPGDLERRAGVRLLPALFETAGYEPAYRFWVYEIDFASERYRDVSRAAIDDARCTVRPFNKKRWSDEVETLRRLNNETFRDEWEFHSITREEYAEFMAYYKPVFDERQFLFAEIDGEPVGACFGQPDWTPLFRSFNGRMGPVEIARYMLQAKRFDRAGLILIGVLDEHRGKHIGQTLAATLFRHYEDRGLRSALYYPVNEHNLASRRLAESFGARGRNLYTVYEKRLS